MCDAALGGAGWRLVDLGVVGDAFARPDGEHEARLEFEPGDGAEFELLAHDAVGGEAEAVAVEADGPGQIVDAKGDDGDARLHGSSVGVRPKSIMFLPRRRWSARFACRWLRYFLPCY